MSDGRGAAVERGLQDLGLDEPIEVHLAALAREPRPLLAAIMCLARRDEASPRLRALLERAADGAPLSGEEGRLLSRGIRLLAAMGEAGACTPLLRLLLRPLAQLDAQLGEGFANSLASSVVGLFDGDAEALFAAIQDPRRHELVRDGLIGAAAYLTWEKRIDGRRLAEFLVTLDDGRPAPDGDLVWVGWLQAVALLGLRPLAPRVERALGEGRVPRGFFTLADFRLELAEAERRPRDVQRFKRRNLWRIDDVDAELSRWSPPERDTSSPPVVNAWRHVGRNDPCPCGSGSKAKRCCLAA